MTAKENARPVVGATGTGGKTEVTIIHSPVFNPTTRRGTRQDVTARNFTNGDIFQRAKAVSILDTVRRLGLGEPDRNGKILCPFHNDHHPSLHIDAAKNRWRCFVCEDKRGDAIDLVAEYRQIGKREAAQWLLGEESPKPKVPSDSGKIDEYVYNYPDGNRAKKRIRRFSDGTPKQVLGWQHWQDGQWESGRGSLPPILYECGNHSEDVFIVEGEKDAENFAALYDGLAYVVSGADGAGAGWKELYTEQLKSSGVKNAVILSDNDESGRKYANETAAALATFMEEVKLLDLREVWPDMPEKADVSDLISEFGTTSARSMIDTLYNDTPAWIPPEPVPMEQPAAVPGLRPFEKTALEMLPGFPVQALTPELRNFSQDVTRFVEQDDNALASVPALGVCSTATGRKFQVSAKDGWEEPLDTYLLTAALSGGGKSTVLDKYTMFPLSRFQKEWNIEHAAEVDEWKDKLQITQDEISKKLADIAKGKASYDDLEPLRARERSLEANPVRRMDLYMKDVSPEKLEEEIAKRGGEMAVISSEGGLLENLTGTRYSEKANLDTLLDAYTDGAIRTGRITRGDVSCDHACLNINVMCQPITVQELTANKTFNRRGLTGRFLYAFVRDRQAKGDPDNPPPEVPPPSESVLNEYNALIHDLLSITPDMDENGNFKPRIIKFSSEAKALFRKFEWRAKLEKQELDPENPFYYWMARYHAHAARLAGILHICKYRNNADEVPVSVETFQQAVTLAQYFKAHAEYAFSLSGASESPEERDARYIWKRLSESGKTRFTKSDLNHLCKRFKTAEERKPGLDELLQRGYIRIEKTQTLGRPAEIVILNPAALG